MYHAILGQRSIESGTSDFYFRINQDSIHITKLARDCFKSDPKGLAIKHGEEARIRLQGSRR